MQEIRLHGIGGEGVVVLSNIIGKTATRCGKWAHSFPFFGTEMRGAAVSAFTRVAERPISMKSFIYQPDVIILTNDILLDDPETLSGLKKEGLILLNTDRKKEEIQEYTEAEVYPINATDMAFDIFSRPIVNTILLGALARITDIINFDEAGEVVKEEFPGSKAEKNIEAIKKGYNYMEKVI